MMCGIKGVRVCTCGGKECVCGVKGGKGVLSGVKGGSECTCGVKGGRDA